MKKLLFSVLCFLTFIPPIFADVTRGRTEVTEEDASPSVFPYQIKFANGTVTDNSDGTASVSSSGASTAASFVTTQAEGGLSAEFNLGSLTTGLLKHSVAVGVSTPATAVAGTDYENALTFSTPLSRTVNAISIPQGNSTTDGYINATDWTTFNNKLNTTLASANIYVGNATNITTAVAMSGDIAIDNAGATTIQANSVALGTDTVNNYVATVADSGAGEVTVSGSGSETAAVTLAIGSTITRDIEWDTWAEHPALLSGQILVGNATNVTANVTMSGDGTMSNAGALAISDDSHAHTSTTLPATVSYLGTAIDETEMSFTDITTLNSNTTRHGFLPKLSGTSTEFVNGAGAWATPAGSGMQYTDTRHKVGSFTRDLSTASGTQAVTGVGFAPKVVKFESGRDGGGGNEYGLDDGTTSNSWGRTTAASSFDLFSTQSIGHGEIGASYTGEITSLDSDGFTITWTKTGSPTGTLTVNYWALR